MRFFRFLAVLIFSAALSAFAQTSAATKPGPGFSLDNIDKSVDPCVDFYQYSCGNWMKNSEIPADRPSWQSFSELDESNLGIERSILEKAAAGGSSRNAIDQKIGDLYGSCMDEKAVNEKGIAPLKPELDRVAAVKDKGALIDEIAHVQSDWLQPTIQLLFQLRPAQRRNGDCLHRPGRSLLARSRLLPERRRPHGRNA